MSVETKKRALLKRVEDEISAANPDFILPVHLDVLSALSIIGTLQLALRHPANTGAAAAVARSTIDGLIAMLTEYGFTATAELARLGDNRDYDD